jgi:hypothetical protein
MRKMIRRLFTWISECLAAMVDDDRDKPSPRLLNHGLPSTT